MYLNTLLLVDYYCFLYQKTYFLLNAGESIPPLLVEIGIGGGKWRALGTISPGDREGSFTNDKPDGRREVIAFNCSPDDALSTIRRTDTPEVSDGFGNRKLLIQAGETGPRFELVKKLRSGESHEMPLTVDGRPEVVKFTHI